MEKEVRVDKWLWMVRVYKTRSLAAEACRGGQVEIDKQTVKPSRIVKTGDVISARTGVMVRTLRVTDAPRSRVGPKFLKDFADDLTPASEYEKQQERQGIRAVKGFGRPTKKTRRLWERFTGDGGV